MMTVVSTSRIGGFEVLLVAAGEYRVRRSGSHVLGIRHESATSAILEGFGPIQFLQRAQLAGRPHKPFLSGATPDAASTFPAVAAGFIGVNTSQGAPGALAVTSSNESPARVSPGLLVEAGPLAGAKASASWAG